MFFFQNGTMLDFILVFFGLTWLLMASFFDLATREVPDWISYSMIALGLTFRLFASIIDKSIWPFMYGLLGYGVFFILGCFMYYTKQWGGGDAKLLMGIGAVFATPFFGAEYSWPYWLIIMLNILICGAIYSLVWMDVLAIKNWKQTIHKLHKQNFRGLIITALIAIIVTSLSYIFLPRTFTVIIAVTSVLGLFTIVLLHYAKAIEGIAMIKKIPLAQATEGDWLAKDVKVGRKLIISKESLGLTKEDLKKLKKLKIKEVCIRYGIPFAPALFLGVAITVWAGNIITLVL